MIASIRRMPMWLVALAAAVLLSLAAVAAVVFSPTNPIASSVQAHETDDGVEDVDQDENEDSYERTDVVDDRSEDRRTLIDIDLLNLPL